ncbi:MAG: EamA family transporter [Bdellovibrionota bacterium]
MNLQIFAGFKTHTKNHFLTLGALISTILMWASAFIGIRVGMQEYHAGSFSLLRLGFGAICMLIIYKIKPPKNPLAKKDMLSAALLGVIGMGIYHFFLNLGELTVSAGIASFIIAQSPVFTILLSVIFLQEKISKFRWFGLFVSICGVFLIAAGEAQNAQFDIGVIYILISTFAISVYVTQAKQLLTRMSCLYSTVFVVLGGAASSLIFLPQLVHDLPRASAAATWSAIYLGVFPTAIACLTFNYALSRLSRVTASSWMYAMPLVASLMGWLMLGELPSSFAFIGGMVALSGTVLANTTFYLRAPSLFSSLLASLKELRQK